MHPRRIAVAIIREVAILRKERKHQRRVGGVIVRVLSLMLASAILCDGSAKADLLLHERPAITYMGSIGFSQHGQCGNGYYLQLENHFTVPMAAVVCKITKTNMESGVTISREFVPYHLAKGEVRSLGCTASGNAIYGYRISWRDVEADGYVPNLPDDAASGLTRTRNNRGAGMIENETAKRIIISYKIGNGAWTPAVLQPGEGVAVAPNGAARSASFQTPYPSVDLTCDDDKP